MDRSFLIIISSGFSYNSIEYFREGLSLDDKKENKSDIKSQNTRIVKPERSHVFSMENRQKMTLTGVLNVESFNEQEILLETVLGMLTVKGTSLHMSRLNLETGDLIIDGEVDSCVYSEKQDFKTKGKGFLSKMFK